MVGAPLGGNPGGIAAVECRAQAAEGNQSVVHRAMQSHDRAAHERAEQLAAEAPEYTAVATLLSMSVALVGAERNVAAQEVAGRRRGEATRRRGEAAWRGGVVRRRRLAFSIFLVCCSYDYSRCVALAVALFRGPERTISGSARRDEVGPRGEQHGVTQTVLTHVKTPLLPLF